MNAREVITQLVEAGVAAQGPQGLLQRSALATRCLDEMFRLADIGIKAEADSKTEAQSND